MSEFHYEVSRLPNGVRIASVAMPQMRSVCMGVWAGVGGRHEAGEVSGVSHFIEHLVFKGTRRRSAREISVAVEGVGGYLNAFTSEDHTCFYGKSAAEHFPRVCEVLGDVYCHARLHPDEVEREREVIREEILMYHDQPGHVAQELLSAALWPGHALGRPLTGTPESLARISLAQIRAFLRSNYCGANTVVTVAGRVDHDVVVREVSRWAARLPAGRAPSFVKAPRTPRKTRIAVRNHESEQVHVALGFHAWGRRDARRFALKLFSVLLGENMSSRLFQKLRERHGLCYSIASGMLALADTGAMHISAGLDPKRLEQALKMTLREISSLAERGPSGAELRMARDYTVGQTLIGLESTTSQVMWMGESLLSYGHVLAPGEAEERIRAVNADAVRDVARALLDPGRLAAAIVGPVKDAERVEECLRSAC